MSIDAWAKVALFTRMWTWCGRVKCWDRLCILGRAPRTKETLPDFHEWCRVTRHSRIFRGLMGFQRTLGNWGVIALYQSLGI